MTMGAAAAPGMARTEPARVHRLHYRLTRGVATRVLLSLSLLSCVTLLRLFLPLRNRSFCSNPLFCLPLSVSLLLSLSHSSSFSFSLTDSDYLPLLTTLPSPSSSPRLLPLLLPPPCLPIFQLRLTLCQLCSDYRRFTLDRQPRFHLPYVLSFPLTRAVNEIYAEDINRHSLRSR